MTYTEGEMEQAQIDLAYEFDLPVVLVNGYYQVDRSGRKRGEDMSYPEDINRVAFHAAMLVYERYQEDSATAYRNGKQELIQEWFDGDNENLLENALSMMDLTNQAVFRRIIEDLHPECQSRSEILFMLDDWGIR